MNAPAPPVRQASFSAKATEGRHREVDLDDESAAPEGAMCRARQGGFDQCRLELKGE